MTTFRGSAARTESWEHFEFSVADGVATVTFNRPDKLNALTFSVYADLRDLLGEISTRDDIAVLVITGRGKGFCSGGDVEEIIGELQTMESADLLDFTRMTGSVVQRMRELPVPIVAGINGTTAGAGAAIALAADLRIVVRSAKFAFLFTKVGLSGADMGATYMLPRLIGMAKATELLMLGDTVRAEEADRLGLVTELVDDDALAETTNALARRLADGPAMAYGATKSLLTREQEMSLSAAIELDAQTQALLMTAHDHREFYRAYTEKRDPNWRGR